MALAQINLRIDQELLAQARALAAERGVSLNFLASKAFEQFLASGQAEPSSNKLEGLADVIKRLEVLEQKVAKQGDRRSEQARQDQGAVRTLKRPEQGRQDQGADGTLKRGENSVLGDGAISTADLATATGTNRAAWNNWARDKNPGAIRKMGADVGNWLYLGKFPSELGGPDRGMWERA